MIVVTDSKSIYDVQEIEGGLKAKRIARSERAYDLTIDHEWVQLLTDKVVIGGRLSFEDRGQYTVSMPIVSADDDWHH